MATEIPTITLNDGRAIPQLGFGVFQIPPDETAQAVRIAFETGYRHIDTAEMYRNEAGVAQGLRDASVARDDVWLTTKLSNAAHEPDDARRFFEASLTALDTDHVDLFLIHWPLPTRYGGDFVSTWKTLEEFHADGRARSIGVSNFQVAHLERLAAECDTVPAVNQIELHPYLLNEEVRTYCVDHGIAIEAWSPIAQGAVLDDPTITEIAQRLQRTPAQVVLRWHLQLDCIIFPKSVTPDRIPRELRAVGLRAHRRGHGRDLEPGPRLAFQRPRSRHVRLDPVLDGRRVLRREARSDRGG